MCLTICVECRPCVPPPPAPGCPEDRHQTQACSVARWPRCEGTQKLWVGSKRARSLLAARGRSLPCCASNAANSISRITSCHVVLSTTCRGSLGTADPVPVAGFVGWAAGLAKICVCGASEVHSWGFEPLMVVLPTGGVGRRTLSWDVKEDQKALVFAAVFVIVWCGAGIVTVNAALLGGKMLVSLLMCCGRVCVCVCVSAADARSIQCFSCPLSLLRPS